VVKVKEKTKKEGEEVLKGRIKGTVRSNVLEHVKRISKDGSKGFICCR
jgi:hypothetical protein